MKRPSDELLNEFYEISDLKEEARLNAISRLLENEDTLLYKDYVLERLIQGLASSRAASRFGFSTMLALLLQKHEAKIPMDKLFTIVDEKLDLSKQEATDCAIAQHLVFTAIVSSGAYEKILTTIIERELAIYDKYSFLKTAIVQNVLSAAARISPEAFVKHMFPLLKERLCQKLSEMDVEDFVLLVGLKDSFWEQLKTESKLVKKGGKFHLKEAHMPIFIEKLKQSDAVGRLPLVLAILQVGRENEEFLKVYEEVVEKYATEGEEVNTVEKLFTLVIELISSSEIEGNEISTIFSKKLIKFVRKYARCSDPKLRFAHPLIESLLDAAISRISEPNFPQETILKILRDLDQVEGGNFDTRIGITAKKFTVTLLGKLDEKHLKEFIKGLFQQDFWSIHRFTYIFPQLPKSIKSDLMEKIANHEPKSEGYFNVLCGFLDAISDVRMFFRRLSSVEIKEEDQEVLREVASRLGFKSKLDNDNSQFFPFTTALRLLSAASYQPDEKAQYVKDAEEAELCINDKAYDVFIDLLLSILPKKQHAHRAIVYFGFYLALNFLKSSHVKQILEAIAKTDKELAGEVQEEMDDDFQPIDEPQSKKAREEEDERDEEESEMEVDEVESDEEQEEAAINPELVENVKKALGVAALPMDAMDTDNDSDMDDEALLRLDSALADAFRQQTATYRKYFKEDAKLFRNKCYDLITIYVHRAPREKILSILPQFLKLFDQLKKAKTHEIPDRMTTLVKGMGDKHRKDTVSEGAVLKCLNKLKRQANDLETNEAKELAGKIAAFLVGVSIQSGFGNSEELKDWLDNILGVHMEEQHKTTGYGNILSEVFQRHPIPFVHLFPKILEFVFSNGLPMPRRFEALSYAACFIRKSLKTNPDPAIQTTYEASAKIFSKHVLDSFDDLLNMDKEQRRFAIKSIDILSKFCDNAPEKLQEILRQALPEDDFDVLLKLMKQLEQAAHLEFASMKSSMKFETYVRKLWQRMGFNRVEKRK